MKTTKFNSLVRNFSLGISVLLILLSFNSCAKSVSFLSSSVVPAARGTVKVKMDNNRILSQEELDEGLILTCQSHPLSDKITINYDIV